MRRVVPPGGAEVSDTTVRIFCPARGPFYFVLGWNFPPITAHSNRTCTVVIYDCRHCNRPSCTPIPPQQVRRVVWVGVSGRWVGIERVSGAVIRRPGRG